jgi:phospholipid/cholesterol/gamma-HCH transport system substrate-binding protein
MRARLAALIAAATGIVVAIAIAGWRGERTVQRAHTMLPYAEGVREGTRVTYRGVDVGSVKRLAFDTSGVAVDLNLHQPVPLRTSDSIAQRTMGLLGDRVLDIVPGPPSAPLLPDNGFLPGRAPRPDLSPEEWIKLLRPRPETVYRDGPRPAPQP